MSLSHATTEQRQSSGKQWRGSPFDLPTLLAAAVCPFLSINDLLTCSSLSRAHHPLFDGELVWKPRLDSMLRLQMLPWHEWVDESTESRQSGPPPPSLASVVAILQEGSDQQETLHSVVHVGDSSSGTYHTRVTIDGDWDLNGWLVMYSNIVTLRYDGQSQQWKVAQTERNAGWAANNTHNVVDGRLVDEQYATATASSGNSKQRYIRLRCCSEHEHSHCHRLVQPSAPLPPPSWPPRDIYTNLTTPNTHLAATKQPSLLPLPLCTFCQPRVVQPVQDVMNRWFGPTRDTKRISCIVRVNGSEVDLTVEEDACLSRRCILQRTEDGQYKARMVASRLELYSISHPSNVAPFTSAPVSASEVQCEAHAKLCPSRLIERIGPPSTASYKSTTNAVCRRCNVVCPDEQPMSWCRRCWYTLCDTCTRTEAQKPRSGVV